ncbi:hypothetical protein LTR94_027005 [Friedmanniomyces endolithicus]|nr:hypothetical protein LTR94_027005 [Friedmanniomyces endolithicus]
MRAMREKSKPVRLDRDRTSCRKPIAKGATSRAAATPTIRAQRRFAELKSRGKSTSYDQVLADIRARDERDSGRSTAPLIPAADAVLLDTSFLSIEAAVAKAVALVEARRALGRPLEATPLSAAAFDRKLSEVYAGEQLTAADGDDLSLPVGLDSLVDDIPAAADLLDATDDAPVIRLINGIIAEAARIGASDVHLESYETRLLVRMRVDGVLREALSLNPRVAPLLARRGPDKPAATVPPTVALAPKCGGSKASI